MNYKKGDYVLVHDYLDSGLVYGVITQEHSNTSVSVFLETIRERKIPILHLSIQNDLKSIEPRIYRKLSKHK